MYEIYTYIYINKRMYVEFDIYRNIKYRQNTK